MATSTPHPPSGPLRRAVPIRRRVPYALLPLVVLLMVGEVGLRLRHGELFALDDARDPVTFQSRINVVMRHSHRYDPALGWMPMPGFAGDVDFSGIVARVSVDEHGFRLPGRGRAGGGREVIAVGDSFTFGSEVSDGETWPAQWERDGLTVHNAGVPGYGLDQVVLRAESLLLEEGRRPDGLVVAFIANDVLRCGFSTMGLAKPWFDLDGEEGLALRGVPVPEGSVGDRAAAGPGWSLLARSRLMDGLMRRVAPVWWHVGSWKRAHYDQAEVARRLVKRLGRLQRDTGVPVLVVALAANRADEHDALTAELLGIAEAEGMTAADLTGLPERLVEEGAVARREDVFLVTHYTPLANEWVANSLAVQREEMAQHGRWRGP